MQSRTSGDTTNRIVAALRVVFVGVRTLNPSLKSAPQKNDTRKRVSFGKEAAQSTFLVELYNLGHVPSEMKKMKKPVGVSKYTDGDENVFLPEFGTGRLNTKMCTPSSRTSARRSSS